MTKGKYQKILEKSELSYDDLLVLARANKLRSINGPLVIVRHAGDTYLKTCESRIIQAFIEGGRGAMKEYSRYQAQYEPAGSPITILYEFDTEEEMNASGLLDDPRRTTCFMSAGAYYVGGHFEEEAADHD